MATYEAIQLQWTIETIVAFSVILQQLYSHNNESQHISMANSASETPCSINHRIQPLAGTQIHHLKETSH